MITEGQITKEVKAELIETSIRHKQGNRLVTAQRFYLDGENQVVLSIISSILEGIETLESDLQSVLMANPIA